MSVPGPIPGKPLAGADHPSKTPYFPIPSADICPEISIQPSTSVSLSTTSTPTSALYNFRLLEALQSDDPRRVQPFLDELRPSSGSADGMEDAAKAGKLLGMAVRVASGT